ncbi:MAG: type II secretion system protein [bacterium]
MNNKGFTLIETLIYIAIIGGVVASFVSYSMSISFTRNKNYTAQEVQANARLALNLISKTIRSAQSVNVGSSTFGLDPGVLSLSMSSSTLDPSIINLNIDDGILRIQQGGKSPVNITSNKVKITNLIFTNLTASGSQENIGIDLTVEYANSTGEVEFNYGQSWQTAVGLRQ